MADYQLDKNGNNISYPNKNSFLNGDATTDPLNPLPKVDMSLWDHETMCGACHVGGTFYEQDRQGHRLPARLFMDQASGKINPITSTVWEKYDPATGADMSKTEYSPWVYPFFTPDAQGNQTVPFIAPQGFGQAGPMTDPATGQTMTISAKQLMMPNVKEMDCLFCHLKGYDNIMSSVMIQAGNLAMAPMAGSGLVDMMPLSPTYMGYDGTKIKVDVSGNVFLNSSTVLPRMLKAPDSNNCLQCHASKTLKNLPEMFGVTGTSGGFLSSAPMVYDPAHRMGPLGKRMVSYDIDAMWMNSGSSDVINGSNFMDYIMPGLNYTRSWDMTATPLTAGNKLGGGNPAMSGPLYYFQDSANTQFDQDMLKRSIPPFARAEWFKRGDAWNDGQDVHSSFGCAGCHFTGDATHKNQCDPGRGFDMASTTQDGVPPIHKKAVMDHYSSNGVGVPATDVAAAIQKHDTRNTVKRCEFCHLTGKDYYGKTLNTNFGAPDPTAAHAKYGLTSKMVQIADKMDVHGGYGGQGISAMSNFTSANTKLGRGDHLDVMDCTVCHVQKLSVAVRALDALSGMRFPAVVGTDLSKGITGLFDDPAPDAANEGARQQTNQMYQGINAFFHYSSPANKPGSNGGPGYMALVEPGVHVIGHKPVEWKPLQLWQRMGNMEAPLTISKFGAANGGNSQLNFRRKIYLSNPISAVLWNNTDPTIDANGDGVPGGDLVGDNDENGRTVKPSLAGWTDVFSGEPPNKNNTQGYGEPIYDPWIMHDLKAGINFAPSALSVISVGFSNGPYASAYDQHGLFTGAFKYASVWSGAIIFTEPGEIAAYKAFRTAMGPKSWAKTQLTYVGAPFMVTHGIKPTTTYVKGKYCTDCHASNKGFFQGGFTMTGTAVPADPTFDPTSQAQVDPTDGHIIRYPGIMGANAPASNLMQRPLEAYRVRANVGDLRTAFEGFNKLGQPRSTKFEETNGTYVWTTDLRQEDVLYPEDDGAIYYKITDVKADGSPKAGTHPVTGRAYASYLENTATIYAAAQAALGYNVTVDPTDTAWTLPTKPAPPANLNLAPSAIITFNGVKWDGSTPTVDESYTKIVADADGILSNTQIGPFTRKAYNPAHLGQAIVGQPVSINADDMSIPAVGAPNPMPAVPATYNWAVNTGKAYITDASSNDTMITFQKPGVYQLTLTVKRAGKVAKLTQRINVIAPQIMAVAGVDLSVTNPVLTVPDVVITETTDAYSTALHPIYIDSIAKSPSLVITPTTLCDKIKIIWGDKTTSTIVNAGMPGMPITIDPHAYDVLAGVQEPMAGAFKAWDSNALSADGALGVAYRQNFQFQVGPVAAGKIPYQFHTTIQLLRGTQVVGNRTILVKTNAAMPAHITLLP